MFVLTLKTTVTLQLACLPEKCTTSCSCSLYLQCLIAC